MLSLKFAEEKILEFFFYDLNKLDPQTHRKFFLFLLSNSILNDHQFQEQVLKKWNTII